MILVLLGTNDKKFDRLLKAIDKQIKNGNINEKVIVQAGVTNYKSKNMEIFDLIPKNKLNDLIKKSSLIITHGGVGSIIESLENNKKVIAAARLKKYDEHTNDHQKQIVEEFTKKGYILELEDFDKLDEVLEQAKKFKPNKYKSNNENFIKIIENYINKVDNTSLYNKYRSLIYNGVPNILISILNIIIYLSLDFSLEINLVITHIIMFIISLLLYNIMDIALNKNNILMNLFNLILDFLIMITLVNIFEFGIINAKIISCILVCIILYFFTKMRGKKNENRNSNS